MDTKKMTHKKTIWNRGDIITSEKLNKIEDAIEEISNFQNVKIWIGTKTEYDQIEIKDENTLYFIKEN